MTESLPSPSANTTTATAATATAAVAKPNATSQAAATMMPTQPQWPPSVSNGQHDVIVVDVSDIQQQQQQQQPDTTTTAATNGNTNYNNGNVSGNVKMAVRLKDWVGRITAKIRSQASPSTLAAASGQITPGLIDGGKRRWGFKRSLTTEDVSGANNRQSGKQQQQQQRQQKHGRNQLSDAMSERVFGVPVHESVKYAGVLEPALVIHLPVGHLVSTTTTAQAVDQITSATPEPSCGPRRRPLSSVYPQASPSLSPQPQPAHQRQSLEATPLQPITVDVILPSEVSSEVSSSVAAVIPIIVQKCSWRLIESATHASGIFRVNGALRRVAELQSIFDSPPSYGRDVNWDGFKHHDVATLLRRYLTTLPDPVIPPNMYHQFLELYDDCVASCIGGPNSPNPLSPLVVSATAEAAVVSQPSRSPSSQLSQPSQPSQLSQPSQQTPSLQQQSKHLRTQSDTNSLGLPSAGTSPIMARSGTTDCVAPSPEIIALRESTCSRFGALIASLVPAERDLLLSILSLLHYFSGFRSQTMMDTDNLAAIFQPGLLVHPDYVLNPDEYTRAKAVVAFLIRNSRHWVEHTSLPQPADSSTEPAQAEPSTTTTTTATTALTRGPSLKIVTPSVTSDQHQKPKSIALQQRKPSVSPIAIPPSEPSTPSRPVAFPHLQPPLTAELSSPTSTGRRHLANIVRTVTSFVTPGSSSRPQTVWEGAPSSSNSSSNSDIARQHETPKRGKSLNDATPRQDTAARTYSNTSSRLSTGYITRHFSSSSNSGSGGGLMSSPTKQYRQQQLRHHQHRSNTLVQPHLAPPSLSVPTSITSTNQSRHSSLGSTPSNVERKSSLFGNLFRGSSVSNSKREVMTSLSQFSSMIRSTQTQKSETATNTSGRSHRVSPATENDLGTPIPSRQPSMRNPASHQRAAARGKRRPTIS